MANGTLLRRPGMAGFAPRLGEQALGSVATHQLLDLPCMSIAGSSISTAVPAEATDAAARRGRLSLYADLTKARLSALVLFTAAVGFVMAATSPIDWMTFLWTVIGVGLAAGSANAFNEVFEVHRDARMHRTRNRPLPSGRMSLLHGFLAAAAMGYVGVMTLALLVNLASAILALLTILIYVLVYTPLKVRTTLNTWVGAVCGALPPMIGWVAARGQIDPGAWVLAALLFIWQLPHFLALAWLYREDYERGGYRMLPSVDPSGRLTASVVVHTSLILLPTTFAAAMAGLAGWVFAIASIPLGAWMVNLALQFARRRDDATARKAFLGSIAYLPLVLVALLAERAIFGAPDAGPEIAQPIASASVLRTNNISTIPDKANDEKSDRSPRND